MSEGRKKIICLFDVDGTLTIPQKKAPQEILDYLANIRDKVTLGVVGGSDLSKQKYQIGENVLDLFDYVFSENGLLAFKKGELIHKMELKNHLGEKNLKELINFILHYIADLDIPIKRGTFIEFRTGMLNVSPIGRNCSYEERVEFWEYDKIHKVREKMVGILTERFAHLNLRFVIGGMISMDIFPNSWDKTYCLQHFLSDGYDEIHFFGDKTKEGENDFEIYTSPLTIGHHVDCPEDTLRILKEEVIKD